MCRKIAARDRTFSHPHAKITGLYQVPKLRNTTTSSATTTTTTATTTTTTTSTTTTKHGQ